MVHQPKGLAGTAVLLLFSLSSLVVLTQGVCVYSWYYQRYLCYKEVTQPKPHVNNIPRCTDYQTYKYAHASYSACCASEVYVSQGSCCKYTNGYNYYHHHHQQQVYCLCSVGTHCSTTPPTGTDKTTTTPSSVVPKVIVHTTKEPTTTTTTTTTPEPTTTTTTTTTTPEPTTTTTTTTTTPEPTTTTPPTTTTTTTTPEPTTTTPTTTTTTTTTPEPTTTTTTTTTPEPTTTTAPKKKFCSTYRLLNSESANECDYPGITAIQRANTKGVPTNSCNAVFVGARINGTTKPAFFTSNLCRQVLMNLAIKGGSAFNFKIGGREIPIDIGSMFDVVDDESKGSSFFVVKDRYATLLNFNGNCQHPACVFTKDMIGHIDYNDCEVVGYGASSTDLSSSGLRKVKVHLTTSDLCSDKKEYFQEVNTMCFRTVSGQNLFCSNDMGSPVFCKAKSGEKILIGGASFQRSCDTSPTFRIIPYPATDINAKILP